MKPIRNCLVLIIICLVSSIEAAEVSSIRFGKTEQRSRLVIESDLQLQVVQLWEQGGLILEITEIKHLPSNNMISVSALSVIEKLDWNEQDHLLRIHLPVTKGNLIEQFYLPAQKNKPERFVVDWSSVKFNSVKKNRKNLNQSKKKRFEAKRLTKISTDTISIMSDAKNALTDSDNRLAISLLNKLLKQGNEEQKAFALEFLGVAKERLYQLAFAKQYYQRFLAEFSESKNVPRVKQRLSALIGVQEIDRQKRLKKGKRTRKRSQSTTRGSISTDYRQSELVNDLGESRQTLSLLGVDLDLRGDHKLDEGRLKFRLSAGHHEDLTDDGDSNSNRLRYANVSWAIEDKKYQINFGRQRSRGKGIFGRFDGVVFGYALDDTNRVNLTVGAPVSSSKVLSIDPERQFISLSYDWDEIIKDVDTSVFFLNQTIGSLTDRQAVGGEVKYINSGTSVYGLIDYDIFHSELNAFLISASHTTKNKTRYHGSFNQRKSPYISTRNALIGQAADSLEELQDLLLTDEEILDLAADRTLESQTATIQISKSLTSVLNISGSITQMSLSGSPASGGVAEIIEPGTQHYFNTYLQASKLYSGADSSQIGIRISKLSSSDVNSVYISHRYRWKNSVSLSFKLRYDDRTNHNGGGQQSITPSLRLQYQNKEQYFYADFGAILYTNQIEGFEDVNTDIYYSYIGYRYFFN